MAFRFRSTVKLAPGLRVNVGKRVLSVSSGGGFPCVSDRRPAHRLPGPFRAIAPGQVLASFRAMQKTGLEERSAELERLVAPALERLVVDHRVPTHSVVSGTH